MTSYKKLFLSIALFTIGLGSTFSGFAFADVQEGMPYHSHVTTLTDPNLVCGNHLCAPGELAGNPQPVVPVRGN
jgi:hypothetical protein